MGIGLRVAVERFALREPFVIARGSRTAAEVVTLRLTRDGAAGQGECVPYARYGETVAGVVATLEALAPHLAAADDLPDPCALLPAGAARNALDCALLDLAAKAAGVRVWDLLPGMAPPAPVTTAFTLSLGAPAAMQAAAAAARDRPLLKIKLGSPGDLDRLRAVRAGAPDAAIIVDANEGWSADDYRALAPQMAALGVALVEQPLPAASDAALAGLPRPVPICADESCHTAADIPRLSGLYDMVNVKLDKAGGLRPALALRDAARAAGMGVMVGCMLGTSLAMAPALIVAQGADRVDLDGPLLLSEDRAAALHVAGSLLHPPQSALWG